MADIVISGNTSGSVTLRAPDIAGSPILTLPTTTGTLVVTGGAQTIEFAAGSAASPSITFTGDTNTGIFSPAADTIAFTEGGVESMRIDSSGRVGIGTSSVYGTNSRLSVLGSVTANDTSIVISDAATTTIGLALATPSSGSVPYIFGNSALAFGSNGAERMRIDSVGRVGIGNNSPSALLHVTNNSNTYAGGILIGSAGVASGYISTTDNLYIKPNTTANTTSGVVVIQDFSNANKITLSSVNGTIGLGGASVASTGVGITFPATQSASSDANTLDDYEEGSWTPVIGGDAGTSGQSYSTQTGVYRKIGGFVYACFDVTLSAKGTITGTLTIAGFPFAASGTANVGNAGGPIVYWGSLATSWNMIGGHFGNGNTYMNLYGATGSGNTTTTALNTNDVNNTSRFMGFAVYPAS